MQLLGGDCHRIATRCSGRRKLVSINPIIVCIFKVIWRSGCRERLRTWRARACLMVRLSCILFFPASRTTFFSFSHCASKWGTIDGMSGTTSWPQARQDEGDARRTRDGAGRIRQERVHACTRRLFRDQHARSVVDSTGWKAPVTETVPPRVGTEPLIPPSSTTWYTFYGRAPDAIDARERVARDFPSLSGWPNVLKEATGDSATGAVNSCLMTISSRCRSRGAGCLVICN